MEHISSRLVGVVTVAAALFGLVACGGGGDTAPDAATPIVANIRFVNGSNDAGPMTIQTQSVVAQHLAYGTVSPPHYGGVTADAGASIRVTPDSGGAAITCNTPYQLTPGGFYTVVVVGSVSPALAGTNEGLQCQIFYENYVSLLSTQGQIQFHNVAPFFFAAGTSALTFGRFDPSKAMPAVGSQLQALGTPDGSSTFTTYVQPGTNCATGVVQSTTFSVLASAQLGIYVGNSTTVLMTFFPSQSSIGTAASTALPDPSNYFPLANASALSVYVLDSATSTGGIDVLGVLD